NVPEDTTIETIKEIYMTGWETGCFVEGTTINTSTGIKAIEDIVVGDLVVAEDGKYYPVNVVHDLKPEPRVIVEIKANGLQTLKATADHPIRVLSMIGQNQDKIAWENREKILVWKRADEICTEDYLVVPVPVNDNQKIESFSTAETIGSDIVVKDGRVFPARKLPWKSSITVKAAAGKSIPDKIILDA